ncbi:uncharacterized protein LOC106079113 [Biomphalaria glabrata]|uniref:Uncharacterized protein LOC106079113 n=2 Tax=Biomphalaria glabrata TaxID=6526 RepID=A0A9W2ZD29_BIOGL|nr:uncharacterized protein LOC106079113 [Biomphalaria glabrata]
MRHGTLVKLILLIYIKYSSGVSTTVGLEFIFPTPVMSGWKPTVHVLLVTMVRSVQIEWKYPDKETQFRSFQLERQKKVIVDILSENVVKLTRPDQIFTVMSHRISGNNRFSVTLILQNSMSSLAAVKLLPLPGWGKRYYVVTLKSMPFILVSAGTHKTQVIVTLIDNTNFKKYLPLNSSNKIRRQLKEAETLVITNCDQDGSVDLTGSEVKSDNAVGVISGSCNVTTNVGASYDQDMAAEMYLPIVSFGKLFVIINTPRQLLRSYIVIIASDQKTDITYFSDSTAQWTKSLHKAGVLEQIPIASDMASYLTATKGVLIVLVLKSDISQSNYGDSTMCLLVPTNLFYDSYTWVNPLLTDVHFTFYAIIVSEESMRYLIAVDESLVQCSWQKVTGLSSYSVCHFSLRHEPSEHNIMTQHAKQFGCYIYAEADVTSFMYPAGFVSGLINENRCAHSSMTESDLLDNDCDHWIDEESLNEKDDDNDGLTDEDVGNRPRRNGDWGAWLTWTCDATCGNGSSIVRHRLCDNPYPRNDGLDCIGEESEDIKQACNTSLICPDKCPVGTFGFNCSQRCTNCVPDCNKLNGSCDLCTDGYTDSLNHCNKSCPEWTYGPGCFGDCQIKCLVDCQERIYGTCEDILTFKEILVFVTLCPIILAVLVVCVLKLKYYFDQPHGVVDTGSHSTITTVDTNKSMTTAATETEATTLWTNTTEQASR